MNIITETQALSTVECPDFILENHWQEWLKSGVNASIIAKNVRSFTDSRELDKAINRNNTRRHKHSDSLVPAWTVSGVDPESGEHWLNGIQAKPDNPETRNGRLQKYIGASAYDAAPLFLEVDDFNYWMGVIENLNIPIIITEGAKKAACLLSNGYAAISIPGVSTCKKKGRLHKLLHKFCGFGRTFYLGFDNDLIIKRPVQYALTNLARELCAANSKVMVIVLPDGEAKGVDDFIVANGRGEFDKLITSAQTIEEWKEANDLDWAARQEKLKKTKNSKLARNIHLVDAAWGDHLTWNELKNCAELNGDELDPDKMRYKIAMELDADINKDDAIITIKALSQKASYHPIREYLQGVAEAYPEDISIDNLATEFFGATSEIENIYMRKMLIGAVARAMKPGCKLDTATILYGGQGVKKSTAWKSLFGADWFSDSLGDGADKDELMKIHSFWCLEWAEFETVYRRKDVSSLKKFMAQADDTFRIPYDRGVTKHKRPSILVGTTNDQEVLQDPTGDRRFWLINVQTDEIDIEKIESLRDRLWAAAYHAWEKGEIWWLLKHEEKLHDEANQPYRVDDPWHQPIYDFLLGRAQATVTEIFKFLDIEPSRQDVGMSKRIGSILRKLGWNKIRGLAENGSRPWVWICGQIKNITWPSGSSGSANPEPPYSNASETGHIETISNDSKWPSGSENLEQYNKCDPCTDQNEVIGQVHPITTWPEQTTTQQGIQEVWPHGQVDPLEISKDKNEESAPKIEDLPPPIRIKYQTAAGEVRAIALPRKKEGVPPDWLLSWEYPEGLGEIKYQSFLGDESGAKKRLKKAVETWKSWQRYTVERITADGYCMVTNCKCIKEEIHPSGKMSFTFETPEGEKIYVRGFDDFKVMSNG